MPVNVGSADPDQGDAATRLFDGLCTIGPIVLEACGVPFWRFAVFDMLGAAIWAPPLGSWATVRGCPDHRRRCCDLAYSPVAVSLTGGRTGPVDHFARKGATAVSCLCRTLWPSLSSVGEYIPANQRQCTHAERAVRKIEGGPMPALPVKVQKVCDVIHAK